MNSRCSRSRLRRDLKKIGTRISMAMKSADGVVEGGTAGSASGCPPSTALMVVNDSE